ncbi:Na+/H+ antiporter NhaC family protein [Butyrivibrio sp. AE3004]|uniref:Na+/H+ antiporter NhaC family protein n=1 Tax=Butyrivibrio sp. AE3004 TaxID=1506994 RepID=UPI00068F7D62|nr:Na+/H+ antiporter NhaC family protein [Butyrivibrio sp. AE3004]
MIETGWISILPSIIAIALALITKEVYSSLLAGIITALVLYIPRKILKPKEFVETIVTGIESIIPPMLILILSWSLGGVCRQMIGTGEFISGFVSGANISLNQLPLFVFVIAALMSFSMGTSWGTFGILIPIVSMICQTSNGNAMLIPTLGATLAGSVYGDHCSPISDTTILSSTGAMCNHIRHVETQLPYATLVAASCAVGYFVNGFFNQPWVGLLSGAAVLLLALIIFIRTSSRRIFEY